MYLLGLDIGSSRVKASIIDANSGYSLETAFSPKIDMQINSEQSGWAEQDPEIWWQNVLRACREAIMEAGIEAHDIKAIGISYQMHGLVLIDKKQELICRSIIWCDSRATGIGEEAYSDLGEAYCLDRYLNSPGNFTASKLKWIKEHHQVTYDQIHKILLPGDYIAMRFTGEVNTTVGGLSEAILWDFKENALAHSLLEHYGIDADLIPDVVPAFGVSGGVKAEVAEELGLKPGTPIAYRAGDQPNNAFALQVTEAGQMAATGGTSGVIYGVTDKYIADPQARLNTFAHVNHQHTDPRLGVLLCLNGAGILNSWLKNNVSDGKLFPDDIARIANEIPIGSKGLIVFPFGNGAERMLGNRNIDAQIHGLNFNIHKRSHLFRAGHEGIAFALNYGLELMSEMGIKQNSIRAAKANMFLSPVLRETLATVSGATIELYNTDGSQGAARAAGIGAGLFQSTSEAFESLVKAEEVQPDEKNKQAYMDAYLRWKDCLVKQLTL